MKIVIHINVNRRVPKTAPFSKQLYIAVVAWKKIILRTAATRRFSLARRKNDLVVFFFTFNCYNVQNAKTQNILVRYRYMQCV